MNDTPPDDGSEKPEAKVIQFKDYTSERNEERETPEKWPRLESINPGDIIVSPTPIPPLRSGDRKILITMDDREVVIEGHIGLTPTFLCIGDKDGNIKFAAAPGKWWFVRDITEASDTETDTI